MRMKRSRIRTINLRNKTTTKNNEGTPIVSWATAIPIKGEIWSDESYQSRNVGGDSLAGSLYMRIIGDYTIESIGNHQVYHFGSFDLCEGEGFNIYNATTEEPDFIVKGITAYKPLLLVLERNNGFA